MMVMDVMEAIYGRRSVRHFTSDPVDDKALRDLIDAAVQAPSAINQQPWAFCVVRDRALLSRISIAAKAHLIKLPSVGLPDHLLETLNDLTFDIFYHAPTLIVISAVSASPWAVENCALAAENLMLAAYAAKLGTCWVGLAQSWLGTADGKSALGLPENYVPVAPIIVGHPKEAPPPVARRQPEIRWIGP